MKFITSHAALRLPTRSNWTKQEDDLLIALVTSYGPQNWAVLAASIPGRTGKQCRERWHNHLQPNIVKTDWSADEDAVLQTEYLKVGAKWAKIAERLPGRTDNAVKNRFYSQKRKSERLHGRGSYPYVFITQRQQQQQKVHQQHPLSEREKENKKRKQEQAVESSQSAKLLKRDINSTSSTSLNASFGAAARSSRPSLVPISTPTRTHAHSFGHASTSMPLSSPLASPRKPALPHSKGVAMSPPACARMLTFGSSKHDSLFDELILADDDYQQSSLFLELKDELSSADSSPTASEDDASPCALALRLTAPLDIDRSCGTSIADDVLLASSACAAMRRKQSLASTEADESSSSSASPSADEFDELIAGFFDSYEP